MESMIRLMDYMINPEAIVGKQNTPPGSAAHLVNTIK
jgi:hypothetical protein